MSWALHYPQSAADITLTLFVGTFGSGLPVAASQVTIPVPLMLSPPVARDDPYFPVLERVVPYKEDGSPFLLRGHVRGDVAMLAREVGVPMGLHVEPARSRRSQQPVPVSGLRLRDALDQLAQLEPHYQWREVRGIVVVQPVGTGQDTTNPLYRPVRDIDLHDVTTGQVMEFLTSRLARRPFPGRAFGDSRRFSVAISQGTVFDILNEVVRAHGNMSWQWSTLSERQRKEHATPEGPVFHTVQFKPFYASSGVALNIP